MAIDIPVVAAFSASVKGPVSKLSMASICAWLKPAASAPGTFCLLQVRQPCSSDSFKRAKNPPLSGESQDFLTNTMVQVATGQVKAADAIDQINAKWATLAVPPSQLDVAIGAGLQQK